MVDAIEYDAIVIGTGPNGFGAAITLARAGWSVCMYEAKEKVGGGMRTYELTLPGFKHDICSAIHPMAYSSPFFSDLPLTEHGLEWIQPEAPLAHPFDDGSSIVLDRAIQSTALSLGEDCRAYERLMRPYVENWEKIASGILGPLRLPRYPLALSYFGMKAILPAAILAKFTFKNDRTRAFFAGLAAHSLLPMEKLISASFGLVLGAVGHRIGWPLPRGGSQSIADALASYFTSLGGKIILDRPVKSIDELPKARAYLFDVSPEQLIDIAGSRFPEGYKKRLGKYRYGPGVFKIDWALSEPIPWKSKDCLKAGTIHLGGSLEEIALSERKLYTNEIAEKPFVLLAQQSLFDDTRAPEGKHTGWGYCHVPNSSTLDATSHIENQIERFAPGFKDTVLERHTMSTNDFQAYNANYIGGDINGGVQDIFQLFTRPIARIRPYTTPVKNVYLCSASTPPGGGVHGMCGYHAARAVLYDNKHLTE